MPSRARGRGVERRGVGLEISAEIIQGTATGLLWLLGAWWIVILLHRTWRRLLWREGADRLIALESALSAVIRPSLAGWEVRGAQGRVRVRGGLLGVRTLLVSADGRKRRHDGWPDPEDALAWLRGSG